MTSNVFVCYNDIEKRRRFSPKRNPFPLGQDNPFRYRGYYYDVETGLYYLNARYYNPEWGRFISVDPVLDTSCAVGCNLFAYCRNDPINRIDPSGCNSLAEWWTGTMWWLMGADSILPFGEIVYFGGMGILGIITLAERTLSNNNKTVIYADAPTISAPAIPGELKNSISKSLARVAVLPRYKTTGEFHHIVARTDHRADVSRSIIEEVGINVDSIENIVWVKTSVHRRMHTNVYHKWVESVITNAYNSANGNEVLQKVKVRSALKYLKNRWKT